MLTAAGTWYLALWLMSKPGGTREDIMAYTQTSGFKSLKECEDAAKEAREKFAVYAHLCVELPRTP